MEKTMDVPRLGARRLSVDDAAGGLRGAERQSSGLERLARKVARRMQLRGRRRTHRPLGFLINTLVFESHCRLDDLKFYIVLFLGLCYLFKS